MERNKKLTPLSQTLRKNQTKEESFIWYNFLKKYPVQFRRQYVIGEYIVDFYCHKAKLIVELDGSGHFEPDVMEKDKVRTEYMESLGLTVLRFTNLEIKRYFHIVCEKIDLTVQQKIEK